MKCYLRCIFLVLSEKLGRRSLEARVASKALVLRRAQWVPSSSSWSQRFNPGGLDWSGLCLLGSSRSVGESPAAPATHLLPQQSSWLTQSRSDTILSLPWRLGGLGWSFPSCLGKLLSLRLRGGRNPPCFLLPPAEVWDRVKVHQQLSLKSFTSSPITPNLFLFSMVKG